ncbi:U6 snRNP complex subunit PRP24 [Aspergillus clavatus NRRL 1]|uniref:U4/U6 snRNA-associated-splicing factor PRP24 n=1 Tax=Aspergillus clavatus (strain ATCC 1007 / CBS 513.65 / DSM 816 / NCTC 3887 / NRRL 1 / QM 1276 / 107) TaxID=344612 RepID=A1CFG8_ASPCL|nr:pre-mRNA splicing factor (Prp24), putative [Aspergillus clavatus NRRL 1]EAW11617.1 pre-mRNA splicing factor (Prp24), putative [Aspergillus clavatus NRRL 1]
MDINSLLSPDSNPQSGRSTPGSGPTSANNTPAPTSRPSNKPLRKGRTTATRPAMTSSPLAHHVYAPSQLSDPSPPATNSPNVGPTMGGGNGTPPAVDLPPSRQPSTPGMDTLADLASMQHHQPQRTNTSILRNTETYESQLSPSTMYPHVNPISHNTPTPRTSFDLAMSEGPREGSARRNYTDTSLQPDAQRMATELFAQIQDNPHTYEAHVNFIRLLHQGFVNHVYPPNNPDIHGDPRKYDLLKDMRTAREEMDKLFAMGEDLWAEWIQDESMLAQSVEERIAVMELCQRSIEEEYGSTKLWTIYGEWLLYLYNSAHGESGQSQWTEEDKLIGREVFTWQSVLDVWQRGAEATRWRIHDSHLVWDRFLDLQVQDLSRHPSQDRVGQVKGYFDVRLQTPHATWDQTFQAFSSFVSTYYNANYEDIMADTASRLATPVKEKYNAREPLEIKLRNAVDSGDLGLEWTVYSEYIEWELSRQRRKRHSNFELLNAIYQRAVLRFPTDASLWEDYVMYLIDQRNFHGNSNAATISMLDRATRHCPCHGGLWSQYLLSSEREGQSFQRIADIKHKATSTGLLDAGGMEEVLKVHTAWCSYLRRRAFLTDSTDEDLDVAEVGIRSAIESVQELGEKKYGRSYQGDPLFRLERIYIRYLSESGSWDSARETFKGLVRRRGNSYEFWLTYYHWELISWSKFVQGEATVDAARRTPNPSFATAVLKQAIKRTDLDWPERIMQVYIAHCEDYEDSDELQLAVLETRKATKAINARREREAREAAAAQEQQQQYEQQQAAAELATQPEKRKREEETGMNGFPSSKKPRAEEPAFTAPQAESVALRRDREHSTVVVKNLPRGITEHRVRQFFRHCGTVNSVKMLPGDDKNSETAIIEFETRDEALVAQTRDQKLIDDNAIEVHFGSGSTLFVTNFPSTADESYIRNLFHEYGEIIDVRFPSLKYNTHRRFCYVQFKSAEDAHNAVQLDGSKVGSDLNLVVKISDPSRKQDRHGPIYEGREIHVSNIDWKASEDDLKDLFSKYGRVETVRIPRKVDGGSKGFGYIVFSTKEEANAALAMHEQEFRSRPLQVRLSTPQGAKRSATTIVNRVGKSQSPAPETNGTKSQSAEPDGAAKERSARTLGLMNIPDTVNDARVRALVEPYGELIKVVLRPDHQGAIVEFADVNHAGKASLELEGHEIAPGRRLHVGTVSEMLRQSAEKKPGVGPVPKKKEKPGAGLLQPSGPVKRPVQPGARGGRRGGLGMKRINIPSTPSQGGSTKPDGAKGATTITTMTETTDTAHPVEGETTKKSNDDFRAMIQRSRG